MRERLLIAVTLAAIGTGTVMTGCDDDPVSPSRVSYSASLNAANERQANPVNSSATGTATFTLRSNDSLDYTITVNGLTAAASASHIHVGATTVSGPVVNGFAITPGIQNGTLATGTIVLSKIVVGAGQVSGDSLRVLLNNGNAYVNVHTSTFPQGEIRGQVRQ